MSTPKPIRPHEDPALFNHWMDLYRHLHAHPELSGQERETAARLKSEFERLGCQVLSGIGGHGLAALLSNGKGPTLLLRADMDALPVEEETGLPYASRTHISTPDGRSQPVMHACGHDLHMTVLVGAVECLARRRAEWAGTLVAIGQPAEEKMNGARAMLNDGLYDRVPRPNVALSLHVTPGLDADTVGTCPGFAWACTDFIRIQVRGIGGHGATPHLTRDPVVLTAHLILALQTLISRETPPLDAAALSIGTVQGGSAFNIIPDEVELTLTLRTFAPDIREKILDGIRRQAHGLALAAGMPEHRLPIVTVGAQPNPAVFNDPALTHRMETVFRHELGTDKVVTLRPEMIGEDFGLFGQGEPPIPLSIFRLGIHPPGAAEPTPPLHSPRLAPDVETALTTGVRAMTAAALNLMKP